ncbi:Nin one binding (NOB1) Zn-ribbon like-domain containing protein [Nitzschia inconspicua]|uniref:Nin one binding (NOB1) Zn-ribbon like-domain containing protein n=1 Tax=Nitzschia inconspicua TaxID=303405 RepID=A0A9K3KYA1_9STRA|nr:Nin one binding (NOB1) Zn-ribbon like-domain containing protein [Nitzschia inconspicua]
MTGTTSTTLSPVVIGPSDTTTTTTTPALSNNNHQHKTNVSNASSNSCYYALVVDSGPIIHHGVDLFRNTPATNVDLQVLALSYELEREGCSTIATSNGYSTSSSSCMEHIRTTPKRTIGLGTIQLLNANNNKNTTKNQTGQEKQQQQQQQRQTTNNETPSTTTTAKPLNIDYDLVEEEEDDEDDDGEEEKEHDKNESEDDQEEEKDDEPIQDDQEEKENENDGSLVLDHTSQEPSASAATTSVAPKSWAALLGGGAVTTTNNNKNKISNPQTMTPTTTSLVTVADKNLHVTFGSMSITSSGVGQFDDASDNEDNVQQEQDHKLSSSKDGEMSIRQELEQDFPSLAAAATIPYQEEEDDDDEQEEQENDRTVQQEQDQHCSAATITTTLTTSNGSSSGSTLFERSDQEKQKNLQPISKSGKLYNSFRTYSDLMKPKPKTTTNKNKVPSDNNKNPSQQRQQDTEESSKNKAQESKIMGTGMASMAETMKFEEDDGEGWVTSINDIKTIKMTHGKLDPTKSVPSIPPLSTKHNSNDDNYAAAVTTISKPNPNTGPPLSQRTACATTDFAMQNVLLQMNMILVSVDGMRIRRLKSWVLRCGACFKIHSASDQGFLDGRIQRLFCSHCGSDMLQRISASVDGKTGRLKLHFSKRKQGKQLSTRGTKYSLPKPGKNNKYQGDLLLREDQLLMGAWNQKVKIRSGNAYQKSNSESIFGRDLAETVGCNVTKSGGNTGFGSSTWTSSSNTTTPTATSAHDIRVGFGARKNPNAAKGRERRGKKKKSTDRACGMRRY